VVKDGGGCSSALDKQPRRERARPRAHQSDNRCWIGFDNANPTTESLPAGGGQEWRRSRSALEKAIAIDRAAKGESITLGDDELG